MPIDLTARRYHAEMPAFAWIALLVFAVALAGSSAVLVVHGLRAWRTFGAFSDRSGAATDALFASAALLESRSAAFEEGGERLSAATVRLQTSLAELAVIRAAFAETQA